MKKPKHTLAALLSECDSVPELKVNVKIWLLNKRVEVADMMTTARRHGSLYRNEILSDVLKILK